LINPFHNSRDRAINVDDVGISMLTSLRIKLRRDYLRFFRELYVSYDGDDVKRELSNVIGKVNKSLNIIDGIVSSGIIYKDVVDEMLMEVDSINTIKDDFVKKADESKELRDKIEEVFVNTGVSIDDLNVTKETVGAAVRPVMSGSKRNMNRGGGSPVGGKVLRTGKYAKELAKDISGSLLGPYSDIVQSGIGVMADLLESPMRGRQDVGMPLGNVARGGAIAPTQGSSRSIEDDTKILSYFFNTKAYKTRWTKELLDGVKAGGSKKSDGKIAELLSELPGMAVLLGKVALTAGAIATGIVGLRSAMSLYKTAKEFGEIRKQHGEIASGAQSSVDWWKKEIKTQGIDVIAAKAGKSPRQIAMQVANMERMQREEEYKSKKWWQKGLSRIGRAYGKILPGKQEYPPVSGDKSYYDRVGEIEALGAGNTTAMRTPAPTNITKEEASLTAMADAAAARMAAQRRSAGPWADEAKGPALDKLTKSMDDLSDSIKKDKEVSGTGSRDNAGFHDSADPLVSLYGFGLLSIGMD